jgi:hypothetical protein
VETLTRTREPSYSHSGILDYVVRDGSIKIVTALLNGNIASTSTIYLTVDAGANAIVEAEPFLTEDEAWDACLGFMAKRGGDNWVKEREWQDGQGLKHMEASYDAPHGLANNDVLGIFKHHWFIAAFSVDKPMTS